MKFNTFLQITCIRIWQTVMGSKREGENIFSEILWQFPMEKFELDTEKMAVLKPGRLFKFDCACSQAQAARYLHWRSFVSCREIMCMREWKREEEKNQKKKSCFDQPYVLFKIKHEQFLKHFKNSITNSSIL